jgi:hypothetical protein
VLLGFPQLTDPIPLLAKEAFLVNVILKVLTFVLLGLLVSL